MAPPNVRSTAVCPRSCSSDYSGIEVDGNDIAHPIWSDTRNRVPNPDFDKATVDEDVFTEAWPIPVR